MTFTKHRAKPPPPLKLASYSNISTPDSDNNSIGSNEGKSKHKFFNMNLMSPRSPKAKEYTGFKFLTGKHNRAVAVEPVPTNEEACLPVPLSIDAPNSTPQKKRQGLDDGSVPTDTPSKAIKMLGLSEGSRKTSKAERVLGAQFIHNASSKEVYHIQGRINDDTPKRSHPYDEPSPSTDDEATPQAVAINRARKIAYNELCNANNKVDKGYVMTPSGLLHRSKSLRYMDNEGPPTPPEKDSLKIAQHVDTDMQISSSFSNKPRFVKMFDNPGSRTKRRETNILAVGPGQSQHHDVSLVHQSSIYSLHGIVEGENVDFSRNNEMTGKEEPCEPSIPQRFSSLQENDAHSVSFNSHFTSHMNYSESDLTQLKPAFYTPSLYSCSSQYTRPSRNVSVLPPTLHHSLPLTETQHDSQVYFITYPNQERSFSYKLPTPHPDMVPDMVSDMVSDMCTRGDSDSDESQFSMIKGPETGESETLIATANTESNGMNKLPTVVSATVLGDKMIANAERFIPQFPSAVPTPLYKRSIPNSVEDHRAKEGDANDTFNQADTLVPIVPPEDLLTHFGVVNEHLRTSALQTQQHTNAMGQTLMSAIYMQHKKTIDAFNGNMEIVYKNIGQLDQKLSSLASDVTETTSKMATTTDQVSAMKLGVEDEMKEIRNGINSISSSLHGLVATTDKVFSLNRTMSKKISDLITRVEQLETTQGTIVSFLSERHASFPGTGSPAVQQLFNETDFMNYGNRSSEHDSTANKSVHMKRKAPHEKIGLTPLAAVAGDLHPVALKQMELQQRGLSQQVRAQNGARAQSYTSTQPAQGYQMGWNQYSQGHQSVHDPFQTQSPSPINGQLPGMNPAVANYGWAAAGWDMSQPDHFAYYAGHPAMNGYAGLDSFNDMAHGIRGHGEMQGIAAHNGKQKSATGCESSQENEKESD
jgi:predicted  nucleic acid-binding Zn-ribbon protein